MTSPSDAGRAAVVGTGLIGGSIGLALRARGWRVTGTDADPAAADRAKALGALDAVGRTPTPRSPSSPPRSSPWWPRSTPRLARARAARRRRDRRGRREGARWRRGWPIARFVGGHPMAGSEQVGIDGADPDLFVGATWVLTPTGTTDPDAFARVRAVVTSLGAEVVALSPEQHDTLVAMVSHVPHLTAATLMNLADRAAEEHGALLRLAAGGFRDMTTDRGGTARHLARRVRGERAGHRGVPRRPARRPVGHARPGGRPPTATGCWRCSSTPPRPGAPCRRGPCGPSAWPSCACPSPTAPACWPRSPRSPATSA